MSKFGVSKGIPLELKKQLLQWNCLEKMDDFVINIHVSRTIGEGTSDLPRESGSVDKKNLSEQTLAEVLDSIGKDCTEQVQSYLEQCQTKQDGE
jgi:hypothetical protein